MRLFFLLLAIIPLQAEYDGLGMYYLEKRIDCTWLNQFLPYNPTVVEAGVLQEITTSQIADKWPHARISIFPTEQESLDPWAEIENIRRIDLLHLEMEDSALHLLYRSRKTLEKTRLIFIKTDAHRDHLKRFLATANFILIHSRGDYAVFMSRYLFDACFKLNLGIYLEM